MISLIKSSGNNQAEQHQNIFSHTPNHTHSGVQEMHTIINRLTELSDALNEISLYPEAELVRSHISRLRSDMYHHVIESDDLESVILDFINDF